MLNKGISTPIAIAIILILALTVASFTYWQYGELDGEGIEMPEIERPAKLDSKECVTDDTCIVFGKDGDCNCGCFNKNHDWEAEGACFCAAPVSCNCVDGKCEDIFEESITEGERCEDTVGLTCFYPGGKGFNIVCETDEDCTLENMQKWCGEGGKVDYMYSVIPPAFCTDRSFCEVCDPD